MFELKGKYGEAKVFTDLADESSISQVMELLNQPYTKNSKIRMMPDIHAGTGCTIGTTMTIDKMLCPNLVGGRYRLRNVCCKITRERGRL